MKHSRYQVVLIVGGLIIGVLLVAAVSGLWWMYDQKADAHRAARALAQSDALAEVIEKLKARPTIAAADEQMGVQSLDPMIAKALQAANLPRRPTIAGITPEASRRLGKSPYNVKPTTVSIRNVNLAQLTVFLYHLSNGTGLNVRDLQIRPTQARDSQNWDAQATLTYLIYAPADETR
jgi:hypothetical protein